MAFVLILHLPFRDRRDDLCLLLLLLQRFQAHNPRILSLPQYVYTSSLHYYKSRQATWWIYPRPDLVRVTPGGCAVVGRGDDGGVVLWLGVAGGSSASSGVVDVGVGSSR